MNTVSLSKAECQHLLGTDDLSLAGKIAYALFYELRAVSIFVEDYVYYVYYDGTLTNTRRASEVQTLFRRIGVLDRKKDLNHALKVHFQWFCYLYSIDLTEWLTARNYLSDATEWEHAGTYHGDDSSLRLSLLGIIGRHLAELQSVNFRTPTDPTLGMTKFLKARELERLDSTRSLGTPDTL